VTPRQSFDPGPEQQLEAGVSGVTTDVLDHLVAGRDIGVLEADLTPAWPPLPQRIAKRLAAVPGSPSTVKVISTDHRIARFLEARQSEPSQFPSDSRHWSAVEVAERWASDALQMDARRTSQDRCRATALQPAGLCAA
jgi:hypothetical protein